MYFYERNGENANYHVSKIRHLFDRLFSCGQTFNENVKKTLQESYNSFVQACSARENHLNQLLNDVSVEFCTLLPESRKLKVDQVRDFGKQKQGGAPSKYESQFQQNGRPVEKGSDATDVLSWDIIRGTVCRCKINVSGENKQRSSKSKETNTDLNACASLNAFNTVKDTKFTSKSWIWDSDTSHLISNIYIFIDPNVSGTIKVAGGFPALITEKEILWDVKMKMSTMT